MSAESLPGHDQQKGELFCPQCGHFVGPLDTCPFCGKRMTKRMPVRVFRWGALLTASLGLGLLWYMVTRGEIPRVEIGSIQRTMNFAYVRIDGQVIGDGRISKAAGRVQSVSFTVDDGTGELTVKAFREPGRALIAADLVPAAGDEVDVSGSLNVSSDDMAMFLSSPDQLKLTRTPVNEIHVEEISEEMIGRRAIVNGIIIAVEPPRRDTRAPWTVRFTDGTGEASVSFFTDTFEEVTDKVDLTPNSAFRALVTVESYRDKLQLLLNRGKDLEILPETAQEQMAENAGTAPVIQASNVTLEHVGKLMVVEGEVLSWTAPAAGSRSLHRVTLGPGKGIELVFRPRAAHGLKATWLKEGRHVRLLAQVESTREGPRLRLYHAAQFLGAE